MDRGNSEGDDCQYYAVLAKKKAIYYADAGDYETAFHFAQKSDRLKQSSGCDVVRLITAKQIKALPGQCYQVLGVPQGATQREVVLSYHKKSLLIHPDKQRNPDPDETELFKEAFQILLDAYEVLSDPTLRSKYNKSMPPTWSRPAGHSSGTSANRTPSANSTQGTSASTSRRPTYLEVASRYCP